MFFQKNSKKLKFALMLGLILIGLISGIRINCFANITDGLGWDYNLTKKCVKTTGNPGDENYYEGIVECEDEKYWLIAVESEKTFGESCPGPQDRSFIVNGEDSPVKLNWESNQSEYGENWSVNMKTDMINYPHPCGDGHFTWFAFMDQEGSLPKPRELISSNIISYNDFTLPNSATRCIVAAQFFWDGKAHLIEINVASTNWGDEDDHPGVISSAKNILGGMDFLLLEGSYFGHQLQLSENSDWKWGDTEISIDWTSIIDFAINEGYFDVPADWRNTATQAVQVASEVYNEAIADLRHTDFRISSKSGYGKITSLDVDNSNPKVGDTVKINYTVENIGADDTITVACGPGYLPNQWIFSEYLQEKIYTLKNDEQKTDFCSFVVEEDLYQEQQNGKDIVGIVAGFHGKGETKAWDETKYEDITILPFSSTPHSYPEQTLLKTPDSFKIYIIINQKKKWIPTPEVFETLGYEWTNITVIDKNELTLIPDYEDNLIRAINDYKVYLIVQGIKRHIPNPEIFLNYGFEWNDIKEVNQETINQYKTSLLIKETGKDKVCYLCPIRKIKRWLRSPEIFNSYNNKWEDIQVISKYEMDSYPESNLIKLNNSNDVYLIEGNRKRLINSAEEFEREGLNWEKVMGVGGVEWGWYGE